MRMGRAADGGPPRLLELVAVEKRFGDVVALDRVDLCVRAGEIVVLVGANGSGKTTLLHVAAGLCRPDAGAALVSGARAGSMTARRATALVPDQPAGLDELTVEEHVRLAAGLASAPRAPGDAAIAQLGLAPLRASRMDGLSRGQRRRAALAAALAAEPSLLLVDEATSTLDDAAVEALVAALRAHAGRGGAAVVATHDLTFARWVADRVALLSDGAIVAGGPVATLTGIAALRSGALDGAGVGEVGSIAAAAAR